MHSFALGLFRVASLAILLAAAAVAVAQQKDESKKPVDEPKKAAKDELKLIKPTDAKNHLNKKVVVEFAVQDSREMPGQNICFLNSERDFRSPENFTAFISSAGLKAFREEAKIEQPAAHFHKKKVRVTGYIKKYRERWEIEVVSPDQIKIVEEEKKDAKSDDAKSDAAKADAPATERE